MKISRRENRINAVKMLYLIDLEGCSLETAYDMVFDEQIKDEQAFNFCLEVLNNQTKIDEIISTNLKNYSINRLNYVDRGIIRLATLEILQGVAANICINEALEITKEYTDSGDRSSVRFNNRLLDNINKSIKGE